MLIDTISLALFRHTDEWKEKGEIFLHEGFFMLRNFALQGRGFLVPSQPYLLQEGRVVLVTRGWASYVFNLVDVRFEAGDLVVFYGDTLVEKRGHSDDFQFDAFNFPFREDDGNGGQAYGCVHLDEQMRSVVDGHFDVMCRLLRESVFPAESIGLLTDSLLRYVRGLHPAPCGGAPVSRRDDLLRRFVELVGRYASRERSIPFYADRLCVAPHYLSTLIKQLSGQTVMQWVNQVLVKEIKVWLAYSDETMAQIADRLNFPCPSSLTKFFKRETGITPSEYREGKDSFARQ